MPSNFFPEIKNGDIVKCQHCGYKIVKPYPKDQLCPNCGRFLEDLFEYVEEKDLKPEPKPFKIQSETLSSKYSEKVKPKQKKSLKIDLESDKIELSKGDYVKLLGITSVDRTPLYCSNNNLRYLLELTNNLDYIATGILSGDLDKMLLISQENNEEEKCQFYEKDGIIYLVYGNFPDKKGKWILEQMSNYFSELTKDKDINNLEKLEAHKIELEFRRRTKFILQEYIRLQKIFTDEDLGYVEDTIRIDYIGLSSMSIGVISLLLGDELNIEVSGDFDPEEEIEMKESSLTAKIEAIAANTQGNTGAIPRWIAVRLGFQHYRFLTFKKFENNFFLYLLSEGNLEKIEKFEELLDPSIKPKVKSAFSGNLRPFNELRADFKKKIEKRKREMGEKKGRKFPPFRFD